MIRFLAPIALCSALVGCATVAGGPPASTNVADVIARVQAAAVKGCQFEPDIKTVTALVATFGGPGAVVAQDLAGRIADAVCHAVTSRVAELDPPLVILVAQKAEPAPVPLPKRRPPPPTVNGVPIHGKFVK